MRILHIQAQLPGKTGSGVYFTNIIKELENRTEQAGLYGCYPDFEWKTLPRENQYQVVFPNEKADFPLPGMSDVMPYESTVYGKMTPEMIEKWAAAFRPAVEKAAAEFKPDFFLCHHLWFLTDLIRQWFPDMKVAAISHGTDLRQAWHHPHLAAKYTKNIKNLDHIFTLSSEHIESIKGIYGAADEKIKVLGSGFDDQIFYPAEKRKGKLTSLVYAGKIAESKGLFQLVDTFKNHLQYREGIRLELYGAGDEEAVSRLNNLIKADNRITYHGAVKQEELGNVFREHEIFVLPSYYEGLPLVVMESLACGMHVVVNEFPALISLLDGTINESGWISYVKQPMLENIDCPLESELPAYCARLAASLEQQIEAVQTEKSLPAELHETVMSYSWSKLAERLWEMLQ